MQLSTALSLVNSNNITELKELTDILSPEIIDFRHMLPSEPLFKVCYVAIRCH
jgi:hypothetical protein